MRSSGPAISPDTLARLRLFIKSEARRVRVDLIRAGVTNPTPDECQYVIRRANAAIKPGDGIFGIKMEIREAVENAIQTIADYRKLPR